VTFSPSTSGDHSAILRLPGAAGTAVVVVEGTAYAVAPRLEAAPKLLTFSPPGIGLLSPAQQVTVTARGDLLTSIVRVGLEGPGADGFFVTRDGCAGTTLSPGDSCAIGVRAIGSGRLAGFARLRIATATPAAPVTVGLAVAAPTALRGPTLQGVPWASGLVSASYIHKRTLVQVYSNYPARVTVSLLRGHKLVARKTRSLEGGSTSTIRIKGKLRHKRYKVRARAQRGAEVHTSTLGLHVV
jgi:hypothetical protein